MRDALPVLAAAITAVIGLIAWLVQRFIERRNAERQRKEKLYTRLVESIVELGSFGNGAPFVIEAQQAWLYASDSVLQAINDYLQVHLEYPVPSGQTRDEESRTHLQKAEARIRLAIRRDLRPDTMINEAWIDSRWRPIAASEPAIREYLQRRQEDAAMH
jgi:hypothetical protein